MLWATDARYLNDRSELQHAPAILQQAWDASHHLLHEGRGLNGAVDNQPPSPMDLWQVLNTLHNNGEPVTVKTVDEPAPYVTSFCEQRDLLSQWRGYGGGRGYALEFRFDDLDATARAVAGGGLFPVIYPSLENMPNTRGRPDSDGNLMLHAVECAQIKHPGFEEEKEWRFIIESGDSLHLEYRSVEEGPVPYLEVDLSGVRPIEVMIGPGGPTEEHHRDTLTAFLTRHGWADVPVTVSETPLR